MDDTMRERFLAVARDVLLTDARAVMVLAAISAASFRTDPALRGHQDRVIDVGIREQAMIGVAGGLALEGFRPIVMTYAPFLIERPFEQIKLSLTHQGVHATLISVGGSWDASGAGRTHQAPEDVSLMSTLPGWTIHVPGHPDEAESAIRSSHGSGASHYIRLTGDQNRVGIASSGRIVTMRRGSDTATTVLAVGPMLDDVVAATEGLDVTVLYTSVPSPIDQRTLAASVIGNHIVVVEPYLAGTSVGRVAEALSDRPMMIDGIGIRDPELMAYGTPSQLRSSHGLDASGIRQALDGLLHKRAG